MITTIDNLQDFDSDAFEALPESYKNDDVLNFWVDNSNDFLYCCPKNNQISIIGDFVWMFDTASSSWKKSSENSCG